jgi:CheY-like chemotaxis protein
MNGWEFLQEYNRLDNALQSRAIIIMLTTSENPEDVARAKVNLVSDFVTKPLTMEKMEVLNKKYFH